MTGRVSKNNLVFMCCNACVGFGSCISKAAVVHLLFAHLLCTQGIACLCTCSGMCIAHARSQEFFFARAMQFSYKLRHHPSSLPCSNSILTTSMSKAFDDDDAAGVNGR